MKQTFEFYYHEPKCKYTFDHINFVNKIPSHNKGFKPLYKIHKINPTTTLLPMVKLKVHKVVIFKNLQALKPQQTMQPFAIDLALSILYLFLHSKHLFCISFNHLHLHLFLSLIPSKNSLMALAFVKEPASNFLLLFSTLLLGFALHTKQFTSPRSWSV